MPGFLGSPGSRRGLSLSAPGCISPSSSSSHRLYSYITKTRRCIREKKISLPGDSKVVMSAACLHILPPFLQRRNSLATVVPVFFHSRCVWRDCSRLFRRLLSFFPSCCRAYVCLYDVLFFFFGGSSFFPSCARCVCCWLVGSFRDKAFIGFLLNAHYIYPGGQRKEGCSLSACPAGVNVG